MKRIIAVMIAVLMLATAAFAGTVMAAGEEDITGVWYIQSMQQDGMKVDGSLLASMGMKMILTLNEDGTASMEMTGQMEGMESAQEGTWSLDGTAGVLSFATELTFTVDGDTISVTQSAEGLEEGEEPPVIVFGKEPAAAGSDLAPAVENPELSDFNGTWNATSYVALGIPLPITALGAEISMTLDENGAAVTVIAKDLENGGAVKETLEKEYATELTGDGTLYVDFGGDDILSAVQMTGSGIYLTLHEDGRLSGEIPEVTEAIKELSEMSAESENQAAEGAESAEPAEDTAEEGDSTGEEGDSSDSSSGVSMEMYLVFEKAE